MLNVIYITAGRTLGELLISLLLLDKHQIIDLFFYIHKKILYQNDNGNGRRALQTI